VELGEDGVLSIDDEYIPSGCSSIEIPGWEQDSEGTWTIVPDEYSLAFFVNDNGVPVPDVRIWAGCEGSFY